jgi:ElaB/YqjD/DUF883 family membrane-anchored ribosome-binding protein
MQFCMGSGSGSSFTLLRIADVANMRGLSEGNSTTEKLMESEQRAETEKGELRAKLDAAVERAKAVCERLEKQTAAAAKAADTAVREHPYPAIGIALGLGVLIGVLVARGRGD